MIFSFCVYQVVSKTEFYPEPFYEEVYPETIYFDVDASDAKTAVTAAADFLVNLQLECDEKYFALLDKHNIRYRKREEIIERRPFFITRLAYADDSKQKPVLSERQLKDYTAIKELPAKPKVLNFSADQKPNSLHYRFFRNLTQHQFVYGAVFLAIVILLILAVPQFRELGAFEVIDLKPA